MRDTDVAISGAGIGGAVLALLLARQGLRVTVLEQAQRFAPIYRGEFLQARSLQILHDLGLGDVIEEVTAPVFTSRLRHRDGKLYAKVDYRELPGTIQQARNGHHRAIQKAVLDALAKEPTAEVHMGARVTGLLRDGSTITGLESTAGPVSAWLTVGADGQHSAVRKLLAIPAREFRYPGDPLAVTVDLDGIAPTYNEFAFGQGESALFFPLPENQARLYLVLPEDLFAELQRRPDKGLAYMKERLKVYFPEAVSGIDAIPSMDVVQRVPCWYLRAERWVGDGVALLGDAVHSVSPTRGQGMNLSIQDAAALAELVGRLPKGRAPLAQDLAPYERLRRRPADFIQQDADFIHRLLLIKNPVALIAREVYLSLIKRVPQTTAAITGMYAGVVRPPVWYDRLFVTTALAVPALDGWVARTWGKWLKPLVYK